MAEHPIQGLMGVTIEKIRDMVNAETIIGDPIGREALLAGLRHELIPYTPEQLMQLAERELAYSLAEMVMATPPYRAPRAAAAATP